MPDSDAKPQLRSFLAGVLLSLAGGLTLLGLFNLWVDPLATFRDPSASPANTPSAEFYKIDRQAQMRWLARTAKSTAASHWILGSSRILLGFDTCDRPEVQRLTLLGLSHTEMIQVLAAALPLADSPRKIYLEVSRVTERSPLARERTSTTLRRALFDWQTTWVSFENLIAALGDDIPASAPHACKARDSPRVGVHEGEVGPLIEVLRAESQDPEAEQVLRELLDTIKPFCATQHHEIVFFVAPYLVPPHRRDELMAVVEPYSAKIRTLLNRYAREVPGCHFALRDFASEYGADTRMTEWPAENDWYNVSHFRPSVGNAILDSLLEP